MSSCDINQGDQSENKARPTVEELLRMIQGESAPANRYNRQQPPPLPPKPSSGSFGMTIEAAKRSLGLLTDDVEPKSTSKSNRTFFRISAAKDQNEVNVVKINNSKPVTYANEPTESIFLETPEVGIDIVPPRSSTPTSSTNGRYTNYASSSSGNSTGTNNNNITNYSTSQNTYLSHGTKESDSPEYETLNTSKDTDELTSNGLNQSGGCELIGVNDNSDSKDQSPRIKQQPTAHIQNSMDNKQHHSQHNQQQSPYTVQFFDTSMSSASHSPVDQPLATTNNNNHTSTPTEEKYSSSNDTSMKERENLQLWRLVESLHDEIGNLNKKIVDLSNKVDDLEFQIDVQRKQGINNTLMSRSITTGALGATRGITHQVDTHKRSPALLKQKFSQSTSTINRLTPMRSNNARLNSSAVYGQTYSRNAALNSSKRPHQYDYDKSSQPLPTLRKEPFNDKTTSRSNSNFYNSSSSLYGDNHNSPATTAATSSISPPLHQGLHSCQSPSSLVMNFSRDKRDLDTCTSMLSLSSIGGNSTLKKGSIAGSVSNLSQFGAGPSASTANLLALHWPSQSNFVPAKHQAKDILYDEEERVIRMVLYNTLITMRLPSWLDNDFNFDQLIDPPKVRLKLDWVHGYRGRDCRSNLYYLPTGECVYFVASIVVLYNVQERTQRHYLGHTDSVKCLAIHPNKLIAASGQSAIPGRRDKRPIVRVWNTVSLATIRVIGFNEDFDRAICCLAFSRHDQGATLAVVDESSEHTITLLDWQREKNWRIAEANSGHEPVLAIDFHPMDKYSIVAVGRTSVNFWDIRGITLAKKAGLFDKYDRPKYVLCFTFNDIGETISGDSNGNIIIWPRGFNKPRRIIRNVHEGGVFSILAMKDGSYLTGGRDRRVLEWDESFAPTGRQTELPEHCGGVRFISSGRANQVLISTLKNCILMGSLDDEFTVVMQGHTEATTALAIHPSERKYLTGGFDNQIHLLDCTSRQIEWSKCMSQPITAASYSPNGMTLILGSVSGNWIVVDALTVEVLFEACDGAGTINCVKFSPDGKQFALGSSDCQLYIYEINDNASQFKRIGTCVGHSAPIKEMDWSDDSSYIQSQSMNFELLFWKANNCCQLEDEAIIHDLVWHTQNCSIGFNSIGIWSDSIDSALINYCDRSNQCDLVVSSTDTGYINIYKSPTYFNQCMSNKYYGNVDKFNFIKFLHDDSKLIAVGAKNCATTEWTIDRT